MVTPSIGGQLFNTLKGTVQPFGQSVEEITRPHVDGVAFYLQGKRAARFQLESSVDIAVADADEPVEVADLQQAYADLKGQVVQLVDEVGNTWPAVMVWDVEIIDTVRPALSVGGQTGGEEGYTFIVIARWALQLAALPEES